MTTFLDDRSKRDDDIVGVLLLTYVIG